MNAPPTLAAVLCAASLGAQSCPTVFDVESGPAGSYAQLLTPCFGTHLYFVARPQATGAEVFVWKPGSGVALLKDIRANSGSNPQALTPCCVPAGPRVFFSAFDPSLGQELHVTDGTAAGTKVVKDIASGFASSNPLRIFAFADRVLFTVNDGSTGIELWTTDGTTAGTVLLKDLNAGSASSQPDAFTLCRDRVFFTAFDASHGRELWVTDGTPSGTTLVKDIRAGTESSSVSGITCLGARVFFHASDGTSGNRLWVSDGTPNGTAILVASAGMSSPTELLRCGDRIFFTALHGSFGRELWATDGTATGTVLVKDVRAGALSSNLTGLTTSGGRVFFSAFDTTTGTELYVSDGTAAGTGLVHDLVSGGGSSFPGSLFPVGDGVCYRATTATGQEIWFSDGTAPGTKLLCDLEPGSGSSTPIEFATVHGHLFVVATTASTGTELFWLAKPGATWASLGAAGRPGLPSLRIRGERPPILGTTITLEATGPSGYGGFLVAGPAALPLPAVPPLMQGGCDHVAALLPNPLVLLGPTGQTPSIPLAIPDQGNLDGLALHLQMWWVDGAATPMLQSSNGLQLALGRATP